MNRRRLAAVIISAGLVLGGTSIHHEISNNQILLTNHSSNSKNNTTHSIKKNSNKIQNANENLALNTNIQIAYIGGGNDSKMNSNPSNTYSFAAIDQNNTNKIKNNEPNANAVPKIIKDAPLTFASPLQKKLYEYLAVPANQALTMQTAINLHNGDPANTCVLFQSSALRANGFNIPLSTSYTTELMGNLLENGWERHTDFNNLQPGDICFASTYHTFMFMGWYNKSKKIAYVMGNESFMNSKYYRQRYLNGLSATPSNDNNGQFKATCYYTYNGKPNKHLILSGKIIGGTTDIMSESNQNSSLVGQAYYGDNVAILEQQGHYYKIDKNGLIGWVYAIDILPNGILENYVAPSTQNNKNTNNINNTSKTSIKINSSNKGKTIQVTSPVGLWLLGGPTITSSQITILPYNTELKVLGQSGNWTEVDYNGTIGWCYTQYTKLLSAQKKLTKHKEEDQVIKIFKNIEGVASADVYINPKAQITTIHNALIKKGEEVTILGETNNGWYKVKTIKGVEGYIDSVYLNKKEIKPSYKDKIKNSAKKSNTTKAKETNQITPTKHDDKKVSPIVIKPSHKEDTKKENINTNKPETIKETTAVVNSNIGLWLLNAPSMNGGHIIVMPFNSNLKVLGHNRNWTKVNYNGTIGWCYTLYITQKTQTIVKPSAPQINKPVVSKPTPSPIKNKNNSEIIGTTTISSNVGLWQLSAPSMNGKHITVIPYNTKVNVYGEKDGWYEVEYNGVKGWSSAKYTSGLNKNLIAQSNQQVKEVISPVGLWLLQAPYLSATGIEIMPYKANLKVLAQNGNWTKVDYNGTQGWCYTQYTKNI